MERLHLLVGFVGLPFQNMKIQTVQQVTFFSLCYFCFLQSSPILDIELSTLRLKTTGLPTVIYYLDVPASVFEIVTLRCQVPSVTIYKWQVIAKIGGPYAGSILSSARPEKRNPWEMQLEARQFTGDLTAVVCNAFFDQEPALQFLWIIIKMRSATDVPYHPIICKHPKAQCYRDKFDCYIGQGEDYIGSINRTMEGDLCQPWDSQLPNNRYEDTGISLLDSLDQRGNHNYCRNPWPTRITRHSPKPFCITGRADRLHASHDQRFVTCPVPRCHDCIYGKMNGEYPDIINEESQYWKYPIYYGEGDITADYKNNHKGRRIHVKCHSGHEQSWWKTNICKINNYVGGRHPPDKKFPYCLTLINSKLTLKELIPLDNPGHRHVYKWSRCTAAQCVVRQVWFLFIDADDNPLYMDNNKDFIVFRVLQGKECTIRFFHFGTTITSSMSLSGHGATSAYISLLILSVNQTPEMSKVTIKNPNKNIEGRYTIVYKFKEGDELIQRIEYKANFEIIVQQPDKIIILPVSYCPGYHVKATLEIRGKFEFDAKSLDWAYSTDEENWISVRTQTKWFHLSSDGKTLTIKQIGGQPLKFFLKVTLKTRKHDLEAKQEVKLLKKPVLKVARNMIEGKEEEKIKFSIEYDVGGTSKWIHMGKVVEEDRDYILDSYDEDGKTKQSLIIQSLRRSLQGIYTIEVEQDKCTSSKTVHLSMTKDT